MIDATRENGRIARRIPEEIATEGNLHTVGEVFAEDAVEHNPFGQEIRRIYAIRSATRRYREASPGFRATVEDAVTEGDTVAMRVTLSSTPEGEFIGFEPTGRSFGVLNMVFTLIVDGKVAER